jgi:hypothetical protein
MKMVRQILSLALISTALWSCVDFRDIGPKYVSGNPVPDSPSLGYLRINEFVATGSASAVVNYFGISGDFIELYNPGNTAVNLGDGNWYFTDDLKTPTKFQIPVDSNWVIPSKGFFAVVCSPTIPSIPKRLNVPNFSLSSAGESIGVFYQKTASSDPIAVDTLSYKPPIGTGSGTSYGLIPDGVGGIVTLSKVTPAAPNL